jgi:signal peptidase I
MRRILVTVLEAAVLALAVTTFVVSTVAIEGASMTPTLADGDRVLVPKYETWLHRLGFGTFTRGDVVYFPDPLAEGAFRPHLIKRIVAIGGEVVELRDGALFVDGSARPEPYLPDRWRAPVDTDPVVVPAGHVWVLGDNRSPLGSVDSRRFGPVPVADIRGRAALVLWPPQRVHAVGAGTSAAQAAP